MSIELLEVFAISEGKPDRPWAKIGVAFINRDESINVILDATPVSGKIHIRKRKPQDVSSPKKIIL